MSTLQHEVELYCKQNKILKRDFAASIGITPVKLSHWLSGRVLFDRTTLKRITKIINN